ncbi:hypothetical protein [uncultured Deinococcus sp.]|uniref:hypothetical protein n=1 Tax=uncultured Deinococcus sp. TaxID=158789 RepID=UPI0025D67CC7|nr:hypothetical protein [uncultured Deinococcus sp.]
MAGVKPAYRHKKGGLYRLERVWFAEQSYRVDDEFYPDCSFLFAYRVTDYIPARTFVACYVSLDPTPENPLRRWAQPADRFFDGRFTRIGT